MVLLGKAISKLILICITQNYKYHKKIFNVSPLNFLVTVINSENVYLNFTFDTLFTWEKKSLALVLTFTKWNSWRWYCKLRLWLSLSHYDSDFVICWYLFCFCNRDVLVQFTWMWLLNTLLVHSYYGDCTFSHIVVNVVDS